MFTDRVINKGPLVVSGITDMFQILKNRRLKFHLRYAGATHE